MHRPFLQIVTYVSRALKTITSLFIVIPHFIYLQNYTAILKMSIVSQTYSTIGINFLTISKKIVKKSLFLWNTTTTEVQTKMNVFLPIHSKRGIRNSYNNCYLSVVIQSIMGTELYNFFPSELEAPTNIIRAL